VEHGITSIMFSDWVHDRIQFPLLIKGLLLKNVPYITIYGGNGRGEFVLTLDGKKDIRIECRFQNVAGSVDEKLPYFFETALAFEERIVILIVEGEGYKHGAKAWLKSRCEGILYKDVLMFTFEEFKLWGRGVCV